MHRDALVAWLDALLETARFRDSSVNGLQVEGADEVQRVAVATDACIETIEGALAAGAELLIVHHGLLWGACEPLRGAFGRRVRAAVRGGLNVYASHLPLDAHPEVGNNAELARLLGLQGLRPWGRYREQEIGLCGSLPEPLSRQALVERLTTVVAGPVRLLPFGPEPLERVAVVSGGAADLLPQAVAEGLHALVTGEPAHSAFHVAREGAVSVLFGGHYATETLGVRALARRIEREHGLPWVFLDHPTGC